MRELSVAEQRYKAVLAVIADGKSVTDVAAEWRVSRQTQIILCLYDLGRISGEMVLDVVKTHPRVLVQGVILENPYYLEPDEFLAAHS